MSGRLRAAAAILSCGALLLAEALNAGAGDTRFAQGEWPVHGGTSFEQRYSPLDQIDESNVAKLGLAWSAGFDTARGQEATPIMVDGVLYVSTAWSKVYAYDAVTGRQLWRHDPEVPGRFGYSACCDVVNRGVAVANGRVFIGTIDGRLQALDAKRGTLIWSVQTTDQTKPYTVTGAPRVFAGKVVIGNSGADYGVRGYVTAYDQATGKQAWRFYTVPGDPAGPPDNAASDAVLRDKALPGWHGEWHRYGGGGTVWDAIVHDPEFDSLYIGVGNGSPWNRHVRSDGKGDNLFLTSIVALDPETGTYKWHYQANPGESWDYTATQPIMLATLRIEGRERKVLMQAPKNGFFYVIDRATGKLISAKNFVPVNWATGIDMATGRPIEVRNVRYEEGPFTAWPGPVGGHGWQPMAYSPRTGLVYIPAIHTSFTYANEEVFRYRQGAWNMGVAMAGPPSIKTVINGLPPPDARPDNSSELIAWDPVAQAPRWSIRYPTYPLGGVLATAGNLIFHGTQTGQFKAVRASDGTPLWSMEAGTGVSAGPISYRIGSVQYIAVPAGSGGSGALAFRTGKEARTMPSGRLLVFKLGGTASLPADDSVPLMPPRPSSENFTAAQIERGSAAYLANCIFCHGGYALPDLRRSAALADAVLWRAIVIDGALEANGMASFRTKITSDEAEAIRAYVNGDAKRMLAGTGAP